MAGEGLQRRFSEKDSSLTVVSFRSKSVSREISFVFGNLIDCELNSCNGDRGEYAGG